METATTQTVESTIYPSGISPRDIYQIGLAAPVSSGESSSK